MTCGYRNCPGRPSGSTVRPDGIELTYCVAHEAIARNLPLLRSAGCCASEGCGRPRGQRSPLCRSCRPRYSAWGLDGYPAPQEAPMPTTPEAQTTPVTPGCGDEDLMDLDQTTGLCGMCSRQKERESKERDYEDNYVPVSEPVPAAPADDAARWRPMTAAEVEAALDTIMPLDVPAETAPKPACTAIDGEPSVGDVDDAYSGRWGQYTVGIDPATGKEHAAAYVVELVRPSDHQTTAAPQEAAGAGAPPELQIDRTTPNVRRWEGPALDDVGDVAALFSAMALDLPRSATLRVGLRGAKGFCFFRVSPGEIIGASVRQHFPDVGPIHMAGVAVVEGDTAGEEATPSPAVDAVEPSEGDVDDAPLFVGGTDSAPALAARSPTAPTLAEVQAELARERERAIAAERTAHGAQGEVRRGREAVARLEKLLAGAEERADRAELDAVQERERADEAKAELAAIAALLDPEDAPAYDGDDQPIPLPTRVQTALMPGLTPSAREKRLQEAVDAYSQQLSDVDDVLHWLGAYGNINTVDRLMKVLTPEDRRNILELRAAIVREDIARLKARRLSPPPCGRMEEHAADLAAIEAKIAALPSLPPSTTPLAMEVR